MNLRVRPNIKSDVIAGLTVAISSVPQAIACGTLVGVNPVYGLYAAGTGAITGGLLTATPLLVVSTTNAVALTTGQGLSSIPSAERDGALFTLVLLTGLIQLAAGLLRAGRLLRFVSHAVMTGFLAGVALIVILGQMGQFAGYDTRGGNKLVQTLDLLLHIRTVDVASLLIGLLTLAMAARLPHRRIGALGMLVAVAAPSALVAIFGWTTVATIASDAPVTAGLPTPVSPTSWSLSPDVISTALAVALITLVQSAGVSQCLPGGSERDDARTSRDFAAQGIANLAAGVLQGLPVGGSMSQSALNVATGGQTRFASVLSGIWVGVMMIAFAGLLGHVALPTLAAILILAGYRSLPVREMRSAWRAGLASRLEMSVTFVATLVLPIQWAIALGIGLATMLSVARVGLTRQFDLSMDAGEP
jgi:SulP family sulfate permease